MSSSSSNGAPPAATMAVSLAITAVGALAYYNILKRQQQSPVETPVVAAAAATPPLQPLSTPNLRQASSNTFNSPSSSSAGISRLSSASRSSSTRIPKVTQYGKSSVSVSALYVYPIRGCEGTSVEKVDLIETGFRYDREWAIFICPTPSPPTTGGDSSASSLPTSQATQRVGSFSAEMGVSPLSPTSHTDTPLLNGNQNQSAFARRVRSVGNEEPSKTLRICTLTEVPRMRLISAQVDEVKGVLQLTRTVPLPPFLDRPCDLEDLKRLPTSITVPLVAPTHATRPSPSSESTDAVPSDGCPYAPWSTTEVSGDQVEGLVSPSQPFLIQHQGNEVAEWLSAVLGLKVMLYRACAGCTRKPVLSFWDGNLATEHDSVVFHDFASMTIISEEGLTFIRKGMREKCMRPGPFRPSIVVRGTRFPEEDKWSIIQLGGSTPGAVRGTLIKAVSWCPRTRTLNIDETGKFSSTQRIYNFLELTRQMELPNWKGKRAAAAPKYEAPPTNASITQSSRSFSSNPLGGAPSSFNEASLPASPTNNSAPATQHPQAQPVEANPPREAPMFGLRAFQQQNGRVQVGDVVWVLATHFNLPDVKTRLAAMKC